MQAKQSSIAAETYSNTEASTPLIPVCAASAAQLPWFSAVDPRLGLSVRPASREPATFGSAAAAQDPLHGEALLHDARNLIGTLGLYCDLLSMPGVLKAQHRQYADDLRLVSTRSGALIERLIARLERTSAAASTPAGVDGGLAASSPWLGQRRVELEPKPAPPAVSLRRIVERCTGLLERVAGGRGIEVTFGAAATVPVAVAEEAVERILVNLVRNASAALAQKAAQTPLPECIAGTSAAIRIGVGVLRNRVGDPKPWPFRRVRLTVEDSGCGMTANQLERLLAFGRSPARGGHGIGFRVVRDLVAGSNGDLRVLSEVGGGTCVQIEWPMDAASVAGQMPGGASC